MSDLPRAEAPARTVTGVVASPPRPSPEGFDAVIFDAGGVLLLPDAEAGREAIRSLGYESRPEDWHRAYYAANLVVDEMEVVDWPSIRRAIAAELGIPPADLDGAVPLIEELILSTPWVAAPHALDILSSLSNAGYLLAVVSNASGKVEADLERLGICSIAGGAMPRVGVVIDSHLVGIEKPDPRIFDLALDALGVAASRSVYVGDTVKFDVLGAQAAGLHPVPIDPFVLCRSEHSHVSSLVELRTWLVGE
jgi:putative hydrolase of the HAD superfamily